MEPEHVMIIFDVDDVYSFFLRQFHIWTQNKFSLFLGSSTIVSYIEQIILISTVSLLPQ